MNKKAKSYIQYIQKETTYILLHVQGNDQLSATEYIGLVQIMIYNFLYFK